VNSPRLPTTEWLPSDTENLRDFLRSGTGKALIQRLEVEPSSAIPAGMSAGRQLGIIHGYRLCLSNLIGFSLSAPAEIEKERENYPALPAE